MRRDRAYSEILRAGTLDYGRYIRALEAAGYDGTVALEVFTGERDLELPCAAKDFRKAQAA
jgi:sugar phosphate isomerase/epimerase